MAEKPTEHVWTFQRLGDLDQVALRTADDIRELRRLDPKLWVALGCPASGLQFDARTLTLIDTDHDGRIRIPEVIDAVEWACARLKNPGEMRETADRMPLDAIADDTEDGRRLVLTASAVVKSLGKSWEDGLTQDDVASAVGHASEQTFNGDGILPPLPEFDQDIQDFIKDAMAVIGGVQDASGVGGINKDIAAAFMKTLADWVEWQDGVGQATARLGADTPEAWDLLRAIEDKVDDYFLRCELAAYAPGALEKLGVDDTLIASAADGLLDCSHLAELPLARIEADRPLDLRAGVNPAWRGELERFGDLAKPLLANPDVMTRDDWRAVKQHFAPYEAVLSKKPDPAKADVGIAPTVKPDALGEERIRAYLAGDVHERFIALADKDADVPAAAADIAQVERLVLYHRHLYRLLVNFVNFEEFYTMRRTAAFQSGKLYIDSRCCRLCMPADQVEEHAALAANSQLYLLYCQCTRAPRTGETERPKIGIVAAVTSGDADLLMENRNGVYVDNEGLDWDATVVKIVSNPIGLYEAVWSPYKRFGNMVADQIAKIAGDKQSNLVTAAGKQLEAAAAKAVTPPPAGAPAPQAAPAAGFDIGRSVGIFAAVGLALGALGTAVGSIVNAVFGMTWWQFPLLIGGVFAVISGPSVVLAWLKLRKRTLGPLLEASGWAVNGRVKIDYALSRRLTATAALPPGARRSADDPMVKARRRQRLVFWLSLLVGALAVGLWFWWPRGGEKAPEAEATVAAGEKPDAEGVSATRPEPATPARPQPTPAPQPEATRPAPPQSPATPQPAAAAPEATGGQPAGLRPPSP